MKTPQVTPRWQIDWPTTCSAPIPCPVCPDCGATVPEIDSDDLGRCEDCSPPYADPDEALRAAILAACAALDPRRQGNHWPDPIAADGRTLTEQARDMLVLLDAEDYDDEREGLVAAIAKATQGGEL